MRKPNLYTFSFTPDEEAHIQDRIDTAVQACIVLTLNAKLPEHRIIRSMPGPEDMRAAILRSLENYHESRRKA